MSSYYGFIRDVQQSTISLPVRTKAVEQNTAEDTNENTIYAIIDYDDSYVQPIILAAITALIPASRLRLLPPATSPASLPPSAQLLQIRDYESLDFTHAMAHPATSLVNSYIIRKALIRKHFLTSTVDHWVAKHPASILKSNVKRAEAFEVDYAEFLDDALVEAFDLRASLERNAAATGEGPREWWILKPGMSDRGQGIRLFGTMEGLQGIFDGWEVASDDEDEGQDEDANGDAGLGGKLDTHITTSDLRYFVAQPYIDPPLLLPSCDGRKFHVRTYVLCVGAMRVYVCREMLALFAARAYTPPWEGLAEDDDDDDEQQQQDYLDAHLTNTCLQGPRADATSVQPYWDLPSDGAIFPTEAKEAVFGQICALTGDVFEAAAREMMVHFQPLPWAFEVYGLDFLVDAERRAWLLEVNAFPDFKQTGQALQERVVAGFWRGAVKLGVGEWAGVEVEKDSEGEGMVLVRSVDLGRR